MPHRIKVNTHLEACPVYEYLCRKKTNRGEILTYLDERADNPNIILFDSEFDAKNYIYINCLHESTIIEELPPPPPDKQLQMF